MRDGSERIHDGGPEARERRRRERDEQQQRRAEREDQEDQEGRRGSVRQWIDQLTGHGQADQP